MHACFTLNYVYSRLCNYDPDLFYLPISKLNILCRPFSMKLLYALELTPS